MCVAICSTRGDGHVIGDWDRCRTMRRWRKGSVDVERRDNEQDQLCQCVCVCVCVLYACRHCMLHTACRCLSACLLARSLARSPSCARAEGRGPLSCVARPGGGCRGHNFRRHRSLRHGCPADHGWLRDHLNSGGN